MSRQVQIGIFSRYFITTKSSPRQLELRHGLIEIALHGDRGFADPYVDPVLCNET